VHPSLVLWPCLGLKSCTTEGTSHLFEDTEPFGLVDEFDLSYTPDFILLLDYFWWPRRIFLVVWEYFILPKGFFDCRDDNGLKWCFLKFPCSLGPCYCCFLYLIRNRMSLCSSGHKNLMDWMFIFSICSFGELFRCTKSGGCLSRGGSEVEDQWSVEEDLIRKFQLED